MNWVPFFLKDVNPCKNLGYVYIHSACQEEHFCGEQKWGYVYWNTHSEKKSTTGPVVSISTEQMRLHLAYSPEFCKWATPMEITVKFNSDVIGEPVQFELIWCLQCVWIE